MTFEKVLLEGSHLYNPHYLNRYINFIRSCGNVDIPVFYYTEKHHICPKSMWPEFAKSDWNIITLSARQHFIAHWLLAKSFGNGMWTALHMMSLCDQNGNRIYNFTSKTYETMRIEHAKNCSIRFAGEGNPMYGKSRVGFITHTEDWKERMSAMSKERWENPEFKNRFMGKNHWNYGKTHSEETKKKMSLAKKGKPSPTKGKSKSAESIEKMRISKTGKKLSEEAKKNISLGTKGLKKSDEMKSKLSSSRRNLKRVNRKNNTFYMVNKDQLHNYFFRNGKYYDYED